MTDSGKVYATDREPEQIVTFNECDTQPVQVLDLSWTTYDEPIDLFVEEECVYVLFSSGQVYKYAFPPKLELETPALRWENQAWSVETGCM